MLVECWCPPLTSLSDGACKCSAMLFRREKVWACWLALVLSTPRPMFVFHCACFLCGSAGTVHNYHTEPQLKQRTLQSFKQGLGAPPTRKTYAWPETVRNISSLSSYDLFVITVLSNNDDHQECPASSSVHSSNEAL